MKKLTFGLCALFLGLGLILGANPCVASDTVKVGVVGPRTGTAAATGKAFDEKWGQVCS